MATFWSLSFIMMKKVMNKDIMSIDVSNEISNTYVYLKFILECFISGCLTHRKCKCPQNLLI